MTGVFIKEEIRTTGERERTRHPDTYMCREKHVGTKQESSICKPKREHSEEINPADTLIL